MLSWLGSCDGWLWFLEFTLMTFLVGMSLDQDTKIKKQKTKPKTKDKVKIIFSLDIPNKIVEKGHDAIMDYVFDELNKSEVKIRITRSENK